MLHKTFYNLTYITTFNTYSMFSRPCGYPASLIPHHTHTVSCSGALARSLWQKSCCSPQQEAPRGEVPTRSHKINQTATHAHKIKKRCTGVPSRSNCAAREVSEYSHTSTSHTSSHDRHGRSKYPRWLTDVCVCVGR